MGHIICDGELSRTKDKVFYHSVSVLLERFQKGQVVHLRAPPGDAPQVKKYVALVEAIWTDLSTNEVMVSTRWFYTPQDLVALKIKTRGKFADNEIFYSEHIDVNTVRSILHHVRVKFGAGAVEYPPPAVCSSKSRRQMAQYVCNKRYLGGAANNVRRPKSNRILTLLTDDEIAMFKPPPPPMQKVGTLVEVASQAAAGDNKRGGIGRVEKICEKGRKYVVRYVLGGVETGIHEKFVKPHSFKKHPSKANSPSVTEVASDQSTKARGRVDRNKVRTNRHRERDESFDQSQKKRRRASFDEKKTTKTSPAPTKIGGQRQRGSADPRYIVDLPSFEPRSTRVGRAYQVQKLPECQLRPPPICSYVDPAERAQELRMREEKLADSMVVQWKPPEVNEQFSNADFERLQDGIREIRLQNLTQGSLVGLPVARTGTAIQSCSKSTCRQLRGLVNMEVTAGKCNCVIRKGVLHAYVVSASQLGSVHLRLIGAPPQKYDIVGPGLAYSKDLITFESIEGMLRETLKCDYDVDKVLQRAEQLSHSPSVCSSVADLVATKGSTKGVKSAAAETNSRYRSSMAATGNIAADSDFCPSNPAFFSEFEKSLCWSRSERRTFLDGLVQHRIRSHGLYDSFEESNFEAIARSLKTKTRSEILCSKCLRTSTCPHVVCANVALGLCKSVTCATCEKRNQKRLSEQHASRTASFEEKLVNQNWVCSGCTSLMRDKSPEYTTKTQGKPSPKSRHLRPKRQASNGVAAAVAAAAGNGLLVDDDNAKEFVFHRRGGGTLKLQTKDYDTPIDYDSMVRKANKLLQKVWEDNQNENPEIYYALRDALQRFRQGRMSPDELVVFGSTLLTYDRHALATFLEFVPKSLVQFSQ